MTYTDKLHAFAGRFRSLDDALVRQFTKPPQERLPGDRYSVGRCVEVSNGRAACECCGTRRLKVLWPAVPDGDVARVLWVGSECFKNLREMGKLNEFSDYIVEMTL